MPAPRTSTRCVRWKPTTRSNRRRKVKPELLRRHAQPAVEHAAHVLGVAKPALIGHGLERLRAAFEHHPPRIHPRPLDKLRRGDARLTGKHPGEIARAH